MKNKFNVTNTQNNLIRSLYPSFDSRSVKSEFDCQNSPSVGVCASEEVFVNSIPSPGQRGIVVTAKIPHKILGCLDRVAGIITANEDQSSHTAIVCRAQGVPIVNVSYQDLERIQQDLHTKATKEKLAIDTFDGKVIMGDIEINDAHVRSARKRILQRLKQTGKLKIHANSDTAKGKDSGRIQTNDKTRRISKNI